MAAGIHQEIQLWVSICSIWIGAALVLLGILWALTNIPSIVVLILIFSILLLANAMNANAKIISLSKEGDSAREQKASLISRLVQLAEYSYGLGYSLLLISIMLITYILQNYDLLSAISIMVAAWIIMFSYYSAIGKKPNIPRMILWMVIEALAITFLLFDYFAIFIWLQV
ncbi:MAG: hypothetical protein ACFE7S_03445 [Candidatus Hodarchaeota archaeon]